MIPKPQDYDYVYFDWSIKNGVTYFINDDPDSHEIATLRELISTFKRPTVLIGESTFESYNLNERKAVFDLAKNNGHLWYGTANRLTYRWRNRFGWEKSDSNDARTLRLIAEYPGPLSEIREYKTEGKLQTIDGQTAFVYDPIPFDDLKVSESIGQGSWTRLRKINVVDPESFKNYEFDRRNAFRNHQADAMNFRRLDDKEKAERYVIFKRSVLSVLGKDPGKTKAATDRNFTGQFPLINNSVMWVTVFAANAANSRKEFEALLGAHAHGAKSMMRSQFYHWGWAGNGKGPMNKGAKLTDYRQQVRKLGSLVHKFDLNI